MGPASAVGVSPLTPTPTVSLSPCRLDSLTEIRHRRNILTAFILFYLACMPIWWYTSRVQRVDTDTHTDTHTHTIESHAATHRVTVRIHMVASEPTRTEWAAAAWNTVEKEFAQGQPTLHNHTHAYFHLDPMSEGDADGGLLSNRISEVDDARGQNTPQQHRRHATQRNATQRNAREVSTTCESPPEILLNTDDMCVRICVLELLGLLDSHFSSSPSSPIHSSSGSSAFLLPTWHLAVRVVDRSVPDPMWTFGVGRTAVTTIAASASIADREATMRDGARMLLAMLAGQTCTDEQHESDSNACAASHSLSQRLSFILINDEGDESHHPPQEWTWDFHVIKQAYLSNFLRSLSPYVSLTVDSSVVHYGDLSDVEPTPTDITAEQWEMVKRMPHPIRERIDTRTNAAPISTPATSAYQLSSHALRNLVGSVGEWNSPSPLVSSSLELLVYIPPSRHRPLLFNLSTASTRVDPAVTLFIPRFGSVAVVNQPGACDHTNVATPCMLSPEAVKEVMQVFVQHIRHTLAFKQQINECPACRFLSNPLFGLSLWELDLLGSRLVSSNLAVSARVLRSLTDLLAQVPHMPVSEEIAQIMRRTIEARQDTLDRLAAGDWPGAGRASQEALHCAHRAFFHPDMLPALYFPDEHLYAVYLPLFLPITVPIIAAIAKILANSTEKERKRKQDKAREEQMSANSEHAAADAIEQKKAS